MATWQPPIPAGALYSKPARQLGPALALLAYCYDLVQRDGWLEIVLKDAAGDMDTDYRTMRRWWADVSAGGFFREVIDRGRHGYKVRFKDGWLDWRILQARQPKEFKETSRPNEVSDVSLENDEGQIKAKSRPNERSSVSLEATAYKDDIHDHESDRRAKKLRDPATEHQRLMAAYQTALGYKIPNGAKEATAAKKLLSSGYTVEQIISAYENLKGGFWCDKHLSLHTVYEQIGAILYAPKVKPYTNGQKPADARPPLPVYQPPTDRPPAEQSKKTLAEKAREFTP